jgi:hypothetical protein
LAAHLTISQPKRGHCHWIRKFSRKTKKRPP